MAQIKQKKLIFNKFVIDTKKRRCYLAKITGISLLDIRLRITSLPQKRTKAATIGVNCFQIFLQTRTKI